jgi:RimJ/RimL family protein N-acetyltransferase
LNTIEKKLPEALQSIPFSLPSHILNKRDLLPDKPSSIILEGRFVRLEPLVIERDAKPLFERSNGDAIQLGERSVNAYDPDALIWRYMSEGPFKNVIELSASLQAQVDAPNGRCMCVFDIASQEQVGVVNFMNNFPLHLKIELGCLWYSPVVQRTFANTEAAYLMLKHFFELGYRRIEWKSHAHNQRSRKAAQRIGFKFEGIQESHLIIKGCNRDTAWFRMLEHEWPSNKEKLEGLLYTKI